MSLSEFTCWDAEDEGGQVEPFTRTERALDPQDAAQGHSEWLDWNAAEVSDERTIRVRDQDGAVTTWRVEARREVSYYATQKESEK